MKKNLQSDILLLPALTAGFFCYLFPILIAFWKSLFLGTGTDFVGIHNYVDLFKNEVLNVLADGQSTASTNRDKVLKGVLIAMSLL